MSFPIGAGLTTPDDCRAIAGSEKVFCINKIVNQVSIIDAPDKIYQERQIVAASENYENRILLSPVAMGKSDNNSWSEEIVDQFFEELLESECIFWIRNAGSGFDPICIGPYSRYNRRWLREHSILHNMPTVGFTSADTKLSLISDIDCDYTIIVGSNAQIERFDAISGGKQALCGDLLARLRANNDHYGEKNPFAFMSIYFPDLAGCGLPPTENWN